MNSLDLSAIVKTEILPAVGKELGVKNIHATPRIDKVKVAVGTGKIARKGGSSNSMDSALLEKISKNIAAITNQKPRVHLSKKSISNFQVNKKTHYFLWALRIGHWILCFILFSSCLSAFVAEYYILPLKQH